MKMKTMRQIKFAIIMLLMLVVISIPVKAEAAETRKLTSDEVLTSDITLVNYREVDLNGYKLTLNCDLNLNSPMYFHGGELIVNGNMTSVVRVDVDGKLSVSGNYTQTKDNLIVGGGARITIGGNLNLENQGSISETSYNGIVTVNGNINYNSTKSTGKCPYVNNKPIYRVKGNVIQGVDTGDFNISNIELTGTNQQVILQENARLESLKAGSGTLTIGEYLNVYHLKSDLAPKTSASTIKTRGYMALDGYTLTIDKNLENYDCIVTNTKGKLIVNGNVVSYNGLGVHESGTL